MLRLSLAAALLAPVCGFHFTGLSHHSITVEARYPPVHGRRPPTFQSALKQPRGAVPCARAEVVAKEPVVNGAILLQLLSTQLLVGITIWTGGPGAQVLMENAHFQEPLVWVGGVLASLPLLQLGHSIETSTSPLFAELNLSTDLTVLRLFGTASKPLTTLLISLFLCAVTGLVEETVFRGLLLPLFTKEGSSWFIPFAGFGASAWFGLFASSFVFGIGHLNWLTGLENLLTREALVVFCLQFTNGLICGSSYMLTGDLAVPIIAHAIYDCFTLYSTHLKVTSQLAYATKPRAATRSERKMKRRFGTKLVDDAKQTFYLMDSDRNGQVSPRELTKGLNSFGLQLSTAEASLIFRRLDSNGKGVVELEEFMTFVGDQNGRNENARKAYLLGVR